MTDQNTQSLDQVRELLRVKEQEVEQQLDRIYAMVEQKKPVSFLKVEYKRAVERITEKYQLLQTLLELQKEEIGAEGVKDQAQALQEQYKEDLVVLAVAIDEATGQNQDVGGQGESS